MYVAPTIASPKRGVREKDRGASCFTLFPGPVFSRFADAGFPLTRSTPLRVPVCYTVLMLSRRSVSLAVGIALIGAMSAFFVFTRDPEYTIAASADGVVTVTGHARTTQQFSVTASARLARGPIFFGSVYHIEPGEDILDTMAVVTFRRDAVPAGVEPVVYRYNEALLAWEPLVLLASSQAEVIVVQTARGGDFTLGKTLDVAAPSFLDVYDGLRERAPAGTGSYVITAAAMIEDSSPVLLLNVGERGGCGGAIVPGDEVSRAVQSRTARVLVNDVMTEVTFFFLARYSVATDGSTCPDDRPLAPALLAGSARVLPLADERE